MFSIKHFIIIVVFLLGLSVTAFADKEKADKASEDPIELKNQTLCPVMGGKIDSTIYTDIQGQRVYHCCAMCSDKLKADPDKYFKKAAAEGILFENIQTTCPVSGEKLEDKSIYTDYEGRRIAFCCKQCRGKFNENPQKYLKRLNEQANIIEKKEMKMNHETKDNSKNNN